MEPWAVILLVVVAGVALWLFFVLARAGIVGAVLLLEAAGNQGFIGFILYVAAWVFMFPVMLIISIIYGFVARQQEREETQMEAERRRLGYDD